MPLDPITANGLNTVYGLSNYSFSADLKKEIESKIHKLPKTPSVALTGESLAQIQTHALIAGLASEKAKNSRIATWIFLSVTIAAVALTILAPMVMIPLTAVFGVLTILSSAKTIKNQIEKNKALTNLARLTFKHLPELAKSQENPFELLFQKSGTTNTITPPTSKTAPVTLQNLPATQTATVNRSTTTTFSPQLVIGIVIKLFSTQAIRATGEEINRFLPNMTRFLETNNPLEAQESLNQIVCRQYIAGYEYITNNILLNALYFVTVNDLQNIETSQNNINLLMDESFGGYYGLPDEAIQSADRLTQSIRQNNPTSPQVLHFQILGIYKSIFENSLVRSSETHDVTIATIEQLLIAGFNHFNIPANTPFINQEIQQISRVFFNEIIRNPPPARENAQSDTPLPEGTAMPQDNSADSGNRPIDSDDFSLSFEETPESVLPEISRNNATILGLLETVLARGLAVSQLLTPGLRAILAHHSIHLESNEIIPILEQEYQGRSDCPTRSCETLDEIINDPYRTNNIICNLFHFITINNMNIQDFMASGYIEFSDPVKESLNQLNHAITNSLDALYPGSHHALPIHGQYQIHSLFHQIYRNFLNQDNLDTINQTLTQQFTTQVAPHIYRRQGRNFDPALLAIPLQQAAQAILQEIQNHRAQV